MDIEVIRRICLARHLFELGTGSLKSANELYLFSGVNLVQDAVEAFMLALADSVGASLDEKTSFDRYFTLINEKIKPKELPFKNRLIRLNRLRVDSKHHGIQPARDECERLVLAVREFFEEVSLSILNMSFATVSVIDLLNDGETRTLLVDAKNAMDRGDLLEAAISCRKAIFLEIEKDYDIFDCKEQAKGSMALSPGAFSKAPYYVKNPEYIEEHVMDPTDYIVIDHNRLDQELLTSGVDNTEFWNVWRLTPEVYLNKDNNWIVKRDFRKLEPDVLKENIEYIFSATVNIILAIYTKKLSVKTSPWGSYYIDLNREDVPIYEKADSSSPVIATTPKGLTRLNCDYRIIGFRGDGPFWRVSEFEHAIFFGFVHNDYVM